MKTVLCYGDSNTWGYVPGTGERFAWDQRWPGILQAALGPGFRIIEEGLNSRTTVVDDPMRGGAIKNGLTYLRPCLESHAPLDLVILMLGTNDLKHRFGFSAYDVAANAAHLVGVIQQSAAGVKGIAPRVLLLSPPHVGPLTALADLFDGAIEKSRRLAEHYQAFAKQLGCPFFDVAQVVTASPVDGIHWAADQHRNLGNRLAEPVRDLT
jgi:lysophospholipase L1-like esterase